MQVKPSTVTVIGGQLLLKDIETVYTAKVPVDGVKQSGEMRTGLALNPASLRLAPGQDNSVLVRFSVRPRLPTTSP